LGKSQSINQTRVGMNNLGLALSSGQHDSSASIVSKLFARLKARIAVMSSSGSIDGAGAKAAADSDLGGEDPIESGSSERSSKV